jgi:polyphosphate kinase
LTADPEIGADLTDLFNLLTGYSRQREYRAIVVAPQDLRPRMIELIRQQAREGGRIVLKMNALVDPPIIESLYEASVAGADIDLIVRGICCLRPEVPGMSERIHVRSIVGRYLEHSRIFRFGEGDEARFYIGSADLMQRNLDRRVEAVVPVFDPALTARLDEVLDVLLGDDTLAWRLGRDGVWTKVPTERGINAQQRLQEIAVERARADR